MRETATADNIRAIVEIDRETQRKASRGERIGQGLTNRIGTMTFVVAQLLVMGLWILWNVAGPADARFDPFPFGLMTLLVALEGALVTTLVLIAQNRMSRQTDQRDHLGLQISLLAEQEMTLLLKMVRRIAERLDIKPESDDEARAEALAEDTNVHELVKDIRRHMPDNE